MKIYLFLFLLLLIPLSSSYFCDDSNQVDISNIPCIGLTPINSCSGNVSITNLNTSAVQQLTTLETPSGRDNFTFNFTIGSYSATDCNNNTAIITVGYINQGYGLTLFYYILPLFAISFIFLLFSYKSMSFEDEESEEKDKSLTKIWINNIMIIASFLPIVASLAVLNIFSIKYFDETLLSTLISNFYVFMLYLFGFVFITIIASLVYDSRKVWLSRRGLLDYGN